MNAAVAQVPVDAELKVGPLSAHIGALISGVDFTRPLSTAQVAAIRAALLRWRVIFFREQLPQGARGTDAFEKAVENRTLVAEHPLVRVHPKTGERALYVSPSFLKHVAGLAPRESQALLELLWEHVTRPEFTVRFKWEPDSIAFWDNRATAHLAPSDIFDLEFDRQLYRTTLEGSPVGAAAAIALN